MIMKRFLFFALLLTAGFSYGQTDTIVKWTFPNNPDDSLADGGLPMNANSIITSWGGTNTINYTYTGATTYSARATGWNAGNGVKYWQVFFATTGHVSMKLSSKQRSSGTGPRDFKIQYRLSVLDSWTDVPSATVNDTDNWTKGVLTNIDLPSACDDQDSVYLSWIMTSDISTNGGTVAAGGSSRIDDILITGTILVGVASYTLQPDVKIIQNANADAITLLMNESAEAVQIFDMLGNMVFSNGNTDPNTSINTSKFENGIYIINIFFKDNSLVTRKISVM